MKKGSNFRTFLKKNAVVLVLSLIALIFTLQIIGKPLLLPFRRGVELDAPSAAYFGDSGSVIIDRIGSRLLFLDENERLQRVETLNSAAQLDYFSGVTYFDGSFYIWGHKMVKDSGYTKYDQILRYDTDGRFIETVYEADRTGRSVERCMILDVDIYDGTLYVTEINNDPHNFWDCGAVVYSRPLNDPQAALETVYLEATTWVCSANYLPQEKLLYVSNQFGQLYSFSDEEALTVPFAKDSYVKNILIPDSGTVIWCESDTRSLYCNDRLILENTSAYNNLSVDKGGFAFDDEIGSCLNRVKLATGEVSILTEVRFAPLFGILTSLRFVSPIFLALVLLWVFLRRSFKGRKQGEFSLSRKSAMILALFLISCLLSVFYTLQVVKTHEESRDDEITVMSRYFSDSVDRGTLQDAVFRKEYLHDSEAFEHWKDSWGLLNNYYGDFRDREDETAKAAYISFYSRVGDDYLCVFDSWTVNPIGSKLVGVSASEDTRTDQIRVFERASESIIYKTTPITNGDDEPVALLLLGMDYQLTRQQIFTKCLDMTLKLTIFFITAFLLLLEGKKLIEGLRKKKALEKDNAPNSELAVLRPLLFLFNLTSSFDGVILVLVAKDMLDGANVSDGMRLTLMAVPALVAGIGAILGLPLCNLLSGRLPVKKLTVASCIVCLAAFIGMSLSVHWNIFVLFCILKFFGSILNSVLYGTFAAIPLREKDEQARYRAINEAEMGRISSTILGPLLGGVVAQAFSNEAIYLLNAASFLPVIGLLLVAMPDNTFYTVRKKTVTAGKGLVKYVLSLPTLAYLLLLVIPAMTIGGYKSYLFPIYLSAMDLPQIYITFFYVLALTVAMLLIPAITNALKDADHWKKTVVTLVLIGTAFLGFLVNRTFYWAILILVVNTVLEKILKVSMTMLWPRQARKFSLDLVSTSSVMSVFDQGAYALKETVLSMFLLLGNNFACVAVGIFCILCAGVFSALTGRSAMATPEPAEETV